MSFNVIAAWISNLWLLATKRLKDLLKTKNKVDSCKTNTTKVKAPLEIQQEGNGSSVSTVLANHDDSRLAHLHSLSQYEKAFSHRCTLTLSIHTFTHSLTWE